MRRLDPRCLLDTARHLLGGLDEAEACRLLRDSGLLLPCCRCGSEECRRGCCLHGAAASDSEGLGAAASGAAAGASGAVLPESGSEVTDLAGV